MATARQAARAGDNGFEIKCIEIFDIHNDNISDIVKFRAIGNICLFSVLDMKNFLVRLLIYFVLVFATLIPTDKIISDRLRHSDDRIFKSWNDIYFNKLDNDVIINGSSRAWVQYDPAILDSILNTDSYNLGIDGSEINRQIIKYKTYCRVQNHSPKLLIQNIDFSTIGNTFGYEREQFFPYFHYDEILIEEIDKYENFNWFEKYIPFYRYFGCNYLIRNPFAIFNSENILYKGFHGYDKVWDGIEYHKQKNINYGQDSESLKLFIDFISDVQSNGTKIIFVYAPLYIGATNKIANIEGMYEMFDTIARKYDIPILDYNYNPISYDTAYFYNAMHLNKMGSELFSIKLAHDIDSLGILK